MQEEKLKDKPGYEHLNEPLHILLEAEFPEDIINARLEYAVGILEGLLKPVVRDLQSRGVSFGNEKCLPSTSLFKELIENLFILFSGFPQKTLNFNCSNWQKGCIGTHSFSCFQRKWMETGKRFLDYRWVCIFSCLTVHPLVVVLLTILSFLANAGWVIWSLQEATAEGVSLAEWYT